MPIMRIGVTTEEQTVILAGPREDALGALAALASEVNAPEFIDQVPGNQFCWQEISIKGKSSQSGSLGSEKPNVRYWHKADMLNALANVRFCGQSGQ
jgi:hypothetical protein